MQEIPVRHERVKHLAFLLERCPGRDEMLELEMRGSADVLPQLLL